MDNIKNTLLSNLEKYGESLSSEALSFCIEILDDSLGFDTGSAREFLRYIYEPEVKRRGGLSSNILLEQLIKKVSSIKDYDRNYMQYITSYPISKILFKNPFYGENPEKAKKLMEEFYRIFSFPIFESLLKLDYSKSISNYIGAIEEKTFRNIVVGDTYKQRAYFIIKEIFYYLKSNDYIRNSGDLRSYIHETPSEDPEFNLQYILGDSLSEDFYANDYENYWETLKRDFHNGRRFSSSYIEGIGEPEYASDPYKNPAYNSETEDFSNSEYWDDLEDKDIYLLGYSDDQLDHIRGNIQGEAFSYWMEQSIPEILQNYTRGRSSYTDEVEECLKSSIILQEAWDILSSKGPDDVDIEELEDAWRAIDGALIQYATKKE